MLEKIAKPFVKWVGGKTQLLEEIKKLLPKNLKERTGVTYGGTGIFTKKSYVIPNRNYVFYTDEGYCEDCIGNKVENLQILGIVYGVQKSDAFTTLIEENPWISTGGYNLSHIKCREIRL